MPSRPKALMSWSSGKDSAFALHRVRQQGDLEIIGLLTTVSAEHRRVSMHGVREELLDAQAEALGMPCTKVRIPSPCANSVYEALMTATLTAARALGVTQVVFGDLFLQDIRSYREARLRDLGLQGVFPLWNSDTAALARQMIQGGLQARLTCIDPRKLEDRFVGRSFDESLLRELPTGVDPCGENGEFHTFASGGPMFQRAIDVSVGQIVLREGFLFADLTPVNSIQNGSAAVVNDIRTVRKLS